MSSIYRVVASLLSRSLLPSLVFIAACSGPRTVIVVPEEKLVPPVETVVIEEFDATPYREEAPPEAVVIEHDVPDVLLEGTAGDPSLMQDGFRIQILSTRSKDEADLIRAQVIQWWIAERENGRLRNLSPIAGGAPPVYQDFLQPYWRVRLGDFVQRVEATAALRVARAQFSGAFVAPAKIPVR